MLAGIELPLSGLFQQTTKKKKKKNLFFFFITKKTGFDSHAIDNLHEMQILFSWKNEKNVSKCRVENFTQSVRRYGRALICT